MSRTLVTPLAIKSGSEMSLASGNQSPNTRCTCMSHKPGIKYPPLQFTLSALRGYFADLLGPTDKRRSEEHTSELQSHSDLVCRLLLEKKKKKTYRNKLYLNSIEDESTTLI